MLFTAKMDMEEVHVTLQDQKLPYKVSMQQVGSAQENVLRVLWQVPLLSRSTIGLTRTAETPKHLIADFTRSNSPGAIHRRVLLSGV